jgi:hypothetical protein
MGTAFPFRRLRWGPPRKLPTPVFLRERRPRLGGLSRYFGFLALAALMGVAAFAFEPWRGAAHTVNGVRVTVIDGDSLRADKNKNGNRTMDSSTSRWSTATRCALATTTSAHRHRRAGTEAELPRRARPRMAVRARG